MQEVQKFEDVDIDKVDTAVMPQIWKDKLAGLGRTSVGRVLGGIMTSYGVSQTSKFLDTDPASIEYLRDFLKISYPGIYDILNITRTNETRFLGCNVDLDLSEESFESVQ